MIRVLFVCTGNICRSPTAEGVFRHLAQREGMGEAFDVDSAGTTASHTGEAPDDRAIRAAAARGVDLSGLSARPVRPQDFQDFTHIYAMDGGHLRRLESLAPQDAPAALSMFIAGRDVPDPWYGTQKDFEDVYEMVEAGANDMLQKLKAENGL